MEDDPNNSLLIPTTTNNIGDKDFSTYGESRDEMLRAAADHHEREAEEDKNARAFGNVEARVYDGGALVRDPMTGQVGSKGGVMSINLGHDEPGQSIIASAKTPWGSSVSPSDITDKTVVIAGGMPMTALSAEREGFLTKDAQGRYVEKEAGKQADSPRR